MPIHVRQRRTGDPPRGSRGIGLSGRVDDPFRLDLDSLLQDMTAFGETPITPGVPAPLLPEEANGEAPVTKPDSAITASYDRLQEAALRVSGARTRVAEDAADREEKELEGMLFGVLADVAPNVLSFISGGEAFEGTGALERAVESLKSAREARTLAEAEKHIGSAEAEVAALETEITGAAAARTETRTAAQAQRAADAGVRDRERFEHEQFVQSFEDQVLAATTPVELEQAQNDLVLVQQQSERFAAAEAAGLDPAEGEMWYGKHPAFHQAYLLGGTKAAEKAMEDQAIRALRIQRQYGGRGGRGGGGGGGGGPTSRSALPGGDGQFYQMIDQYIAQSGSAGALLSSSQERTAPDLHGNTFPLTGTSTFATSSVRQAENAAEASQTLWDIMQYASPVAAQYWHAVSTAIGANEPIPGRPRPQANDFDGVPGFDGPAPQLRQGALLQNDGSLLNRYLPNRYRPDIQ